MSDVVETQTENAVRSLRRAAFYEESDTLSERLENIAALVEETIDDADHLRRHG